MSNCWKFSKKILPVWLALITFGLTELAASFPEITNSIYSKRLYPAIASMLSPISNFFPFSLDDIFYISLILFFILLTILLAVKQLRPKKYFLYLINTIAVVYAAFYWLWGFNYYREQLNKRLNISDQKTTEENFRYALEHLVISVNSYRPDTFRLNYDTINTEIESVYNNLQKILKIKYPQGVRNPKPITFSNFFAKATISGYFGPFFNEIHINRYLLPVEYPWTLAHEKSHQFGITSEAEANFYAWMVCNNSKNIQIKYAGNLNLLFYFLYEAKKLPDYSDVVKQLNPKVRNDINAIVKHWTKLRNARIEKVASQANNTYLKTNKVKKGIDDYDGVVKYVTEYLLMKNGLKS